MDETPIEKHLRLQKEHAAKQEVGTLASMTTTEVALPGCKCNDPELGPDECPHHDATRDYLPEIQPINNKIILGLAALSDAMATCQRQLNALMVLMEERVDGDE